MSFKDAFNKLTPAEVERLALLAEEMGEAIQAIGKILRHGFALHHPDGGPTNREMLERECGDVLCLIDFLCIAGDMKHDRVISGRYRKAVTMQPYLHHQNGGKVSSPQRTRRMKDSKARSVASVGR